MNRFKARLPLTYTLVNQYDQSAISTEFSGAITTQFVSLMY